MYDVIARSQQLSKLKRWWIRVPSGHWRVLYGYIMLLAATWDILGCLFSLAFCGGPYTGIGLSLAQALFVIELVIKLTSAVPMPTGILEFEPKAILMHHATSVAGIVDVLCLLPLELIWFVDRAAIPSAWVFKYWQTMHMLRWLHRLRSCDSFRSVTETNNDAKLQIIKYSVLLGVVSHLSACMFFFATFDVRSGSGLLTQRPTHAPVARVHAPHCGVCVRTACGAPGALRLCGGGWWQVVERGLEVCDPGTLLPRPWEQVSKALDYHNALDPFNQLLTHGSSASNPFAVGQLIEPAGDAEADQLAWDGVLQLYVFWMYATLAVSRMHANLCATHDRPRACMPLYVTHDLLPHVHVRRYAAFAALLGDAFGAKNTPARLCSMVLLLLGNVLFALVFGEARHAPAPRGSHHRGHALPTAASVCTLLTAACSECTRSPQQHLCALSSLWTRVCPTVTLWCNGGYYAGHARPRREHRLAR